jgi:diguanylate cyclase (GGDEF)-like protein/PAS domain S-box-containing protein
VLAVVAVTIVRLGGWITAEPLAVLLGAIVGAAVVSEVAAVAFPAGGSRLTLHLRIAAMVASTSVAIYLTGWGPVLGAGYLYLVVDNFRKHGSRARLPLLVWLAAAMASGQALIALGLAPSSIPTPAVHGVALLVFVALALSVQFFGAVARGQELEETRIRALLRHSADAVVVVDADGTLRYASPAASQVLGGAHVDAVGLLSLHLVHPDDRHLAREVNARLFARPGEPVRGELRLVTPDETVHRVEYTATNLLAEEAVRGIVVNARDVSDRTATADVDHQSRDPLTGLANRAFFETRLWSASQRMEGTAQKFAVAVVDLDHFELINATAGDASGDQLLREVADRLAGCVRPDDLVARLGDDEFAMLIGNVMGPDDVVAMASRVTTAIAEPFRIGDQDRLVTCSVGLALCQPDVDAEQILQQAQLAVRAAKGRGGGRCELFDANMAGPTRRRLDLEADLARAVGHDEFVLHYQPVIDLRDEGIVGFEALVRWQHPIRGVILPSEFISLAERSGAIDPLGHWVLDQACREGGQLLSTGQGRDIHVNLSAVQLANPALPRRVETALEAGALDPTRLVLELTETALMEDIETSIAAMSRVRDTGARFAIDDFGTGYSSFAYLSRLPAEVLKLDRSLIVALGGGAEADAVIETVVALAHRMGMTTVAEGVEREAQRDRLRQVGCDLYQGFWFAKPLPAPEAAALLAGVG